MGLVEKWNSFARKHIYINDTFEIGCGRLVFSGIIFAVQMTWGLMLGASPLQVMPSFLTWIASLKTKKNTKLE